MTAVDGSAGGTPTTAPPGRQRLDGPAWFAVLLPGLPPLLAWLVSGAAADALGSPAAALRNLGLLAGLWGFAAFATNLVLGARVPAIERLLFGSLDRMYRFHRRVGAGLGALLLAHGVLMAGSVAVAGAAAGGSASARVLGLLRPDPGWEIFAGVIALTALIVWLAVARLATMRHERFVAVHRLVGVIFAIAGFHVLRVPGLSARAPWLTWYLVALTAAGVAAWVYRSLLGRNLVRRLPYEVTAVTPVHPSIVEVSLTSVGEPLRFEPGQFVFVALDDDAVTREPHPFSITSRQGEPELRLVVKGVGDFTRALRDVQPGAPAWVEGPYGGFWHHGRARRRQVWIAGGIGVTPFLSMARSLDPTGFEIDLYYATADVDEAVFIDELFAVADRHPNLRVIPFLAPQLGFLTAEDVRGVSGDLDGADLFLCGPPPMLDALTAQFRAMGVPARRLHYEDFRLKGR